MGWVRQILETKTSTKIGGAVWSCERIPPGRKSFSSDEWMNKGMEVYEREIALAVNPGPNLVAQINFGPFNQYSGINSTVSSVYSFGLMEEVGWMALQGVWGKPVMFVLLILCWQLQYKDVHEGNSREPCCGYGRSQSRSRMGVVAWTLQGWKGESATSAWKQDAWHQSGATIVTVEKQGGGGYSMALAQRLNYIDNFILITQLIFPWTQFKRPVCVASTLSKVWQLYPIVCLTWDL